MTATVSSNAASEKKSHGCFGGAAAQERSQGWQLLVTEPRVRDPRIHGREFVEMV